MSCYYIIYIMYIKGGKTTGANDVDEHFRSAPYESNIPVLLGLASVWNVSFLGYPARAILPYCQALSKLAPHIQQARISGPARAPLRGV